MHNCSAGIFNENKECMDFPTYFGDEDDIPAKSIAK